MATDDRRKGIEDSLGNDVVKEGSKEGLGKGKLGNRGRRRFDG